MIVYDIETYPNCFTFAAERVDDGARWFYEISTRRHQLDELLSFLRSVQSCGIKMVGYNNIGFDYPVIHDIMLGKAATVDAIYTKAMSIINSFGSFQHLVWEDDVLIPQVDLFKIWHFDNKAKMTSLKMLEFNMRRSNIEDLPYPPGTLLTSPQMDVLGTYNQHDVSETKAFLHESKAMIDFRNELTLKYGKDFTNHNDTKIGKDYFIMELEKALPGSCFTVGPSGKKIKRQTIRSEIKLSEAVFPYITFDTPEFSRILDWFKAQTITETKGVFTDVSTSFNGLEHVFGLGGIHASVDSQTIESDDTHVIIDLDVASYYPNLAIANKVYPAHLSEKFCDIYKDVYEQRKTHPKGTPENAMLKLALNGVYGDSNNQYSPFYDPLYTMTITINGQLLLCKLAEMMTRGVVDLEIIQLNTDGITVRIPRHQREEVMSIAKVWEDWTQLELEAADYSRMFIRDVNNYIAEYTDGKLKRKGAYEYDLEWHQNHSSLVIPKAAEAFLVHGTPVEQFIRGHTDIFDFMLRTKVPRSSRLVLHKGGLDAPLQNITRFYVTDASAFMWGGSLVKIMPPLKKNGPDAPDRRIGICVGWEVHPCNDIMDAVAPINYDYYIQETLKLTEVLR